MNSLISLLESTICKKVNVHTVGHFECELHLFSQNQRLKQTPSQKVLTDSPALMVLVQMLFVHKFYSYFIPILSSKAIAFLNMNQANFCLFKGK